MGKTIRLIRVSMGQDSGEGQGQGLGGGGLGSEK